MELTKGNLIFAQPSSGKRHAGRQARKEISDEYVKIFVVPRSNNKKRFPPSGTDLESFIKT